MAQGNALSLFVDESGILGEPASASRFYILGLVLHDQRFTIEPAAKELVRRLEEIGIKDLCFHAGPILHGNNGFRFMTCDLRRRIFHRMMAFARQIGFSYHCLAIDKRYAGDLPQMTTSLERQFADFAVRNRDMFAAYECVKVYYDCGQKAVTNFLQRVTSATLPCPVEFAQAVEPRKYRLFQVADLVCTLRLLECKIGCGMGLSADECKFFGGPKKFRHSILRYIKKKEI